MIEVRHVEEEAFTLWAAQLLDTFGGDGEDQEMLREIRPAIDLERSWGAFDGALVVGTASSKAARISLPWAPSAPFAAVSEVTVKATHRRRGILTQMMRRQLTELHEREEPLAGLWASEAAIYPRFGYGLGTYAARLRVRREASAFRRPKRVEQVVEIDKAAARRVVPEIQARAAHGHPGFVIRSEELWNDAFSDPAARRRGASRQRFVLHQGDVGPDGYVCYRTRPQWGANGENESTLEVLELNALSAEAYTTLWRYCLDVDLMVQVEARHRSIDEPLRHLLLDARALQVRAADGLWVRLVDVAAALELRRYVGDGELVLELVDEFCPWNAGRVLLTTGDGAARVMPTGREPDLLLDVGTLASLYLGANRAVTLQRAGAIEERTPGSVTCADRLFAADATPWCPTGF
ncbi:MAG: GNAT family N-acetyltransferase [Candidatus Dormibacteraeota bacterium]|nr:GNAT family N-acetyltransferase [Candidatus Dormibacteraeota bacterium]